MSAKPTPLTTYPPSGPVWWLCSIHGGRLIHVHTRFWIDARAEAARQSGCVPDNVLCQRDSDEDAEDRFMRADSWAAIQSKMKEADSEKKLQRLTAWKSGQATR